MSGTSSFPIEILFRNLAHSQAIEDNARQHAEKLGRYFNRIFNCHVIIETHHHHHKGNIYHITINLDVPHAELVVNRDLADDHAHEDPYVALRDAFDAMKRQLQSYSQKLHGKVKHHTSHHKGKVLEIAPLADYGYIETGDGQKIRFSSKSVIDYDFSKIEVGDNVEFVLVDEDGAAASTVYIK